MKTVCRARARPLAMAVLALFLAAPVAAQVTFSTTGSFGGGCAGTTCTIGGITLTFDGISSSTVNPNPTTFTSFGSFTTSANPDGSAPADFTGVTFTLTINQTAPPGGSDELGPGTITGTLAYNESGALFTPLVGDVATIGSTIYAYAQAMFVLVPETTNGGVSTLQGAVTSQSPVPEPATLFLLGTGLLGLGGVRRRRKQQG